MQQDQEVAMLMTVAEVTVLKQLLKKLEDALERPQPALGLGLPSLCCSLRPVDEPPEADSEEQEETPAKRPRLGHAHTPRTPCTPYTPCSPEMPEMPETPAWPSVLRGPRPKRWHRPLEASTEVVELPTYVWMSCQNEELLSQRIFAMLVKYTPPAPKGSGAADRKGRSRTSRSVGVIFVFDQDNMPEFSDNVNVRVEQARSVEYCPPERRFLGLPVAYKCMTSIADAPYPIKRRETRRDSDRPKPRRKHAGVTGHKVWHVGTGSNKDQTLGAYARSTFVPSPVSFDDCELYRLQHGTQNLEKVTVDRAERGERARGARGEA